METMNMLMMLVVAAILFCSHHHSLVMCDEGNELGIWPSDISCYLPWPYPFPRPYACPLSRLRPPLPPHSPRPSPPPLALATSCSTSDKEKVDKCFNTTSVDACCPTFRSILGTNCQCFQYAWEKDNLQVITAEAYCDFDCPCMGKSPPCPVLKSACSTSDKEKVDKCFNTPLIDACCPTFRSILGTNCQCFQYAWEKDNLQVITAESYCDFDSPCMGGKVIKLSKEE